MCLLCSRASDGSDIKPIWLQDRGCDAVLLASAYQTARCLNPQGLNLNIHNCEIFKPSTVCNILRSLADRFCARHSSQSSTREFFLCRLIFCDVTSCSLVEVRRHLGGIQCAKFVCSVCCLQVSCLTYSYTLKMEAGCSSEMSANLYRTALHHRNKEILLTLRTCRCRQ
jgi:hypothetical protein